MTDILATMFNMLDDEHHIIISKRRTHNGHEAILTLAGATDRNVVITSHDLDDLRNPDLHLAAATQSLFYFVATTRQEQHLRKAVETGVLEGDALRDVTVSDPELVGAMRRVANARSHQMPPPPSEIKGFSASVLQQALRDLGRPAI